MKLLYTHPNRMIVENMKNLVEQSGIKVTLQNEFAGGGVGELAPIDAWPELWVDSENDFNRASKLLEQISADSGNEWTCNQCSESNAGSFELCWNCGRVHDQ